MSDTIKKDFDDVDSLVHQLNLASVRYREFGKSKTSAMASMQVPAPVPTPIAPSALAPAPAPSPTSSAAPSELPTSADTRLRPVAPAGPLAFTFERLRQQAAAQPSRQPVILLQLPERRPVAAETLDRKLRQRSLASIFAELEGHGRVAA